MANEQKHVCVSPLGQFIILAKNLRGAALASLINCVLETPGIYAFGELLDLTCVKELSKGPYEGYAQLLDVFAYGTYHDYKSKKNTLPPLSEAQKNKLRHLTIASLAENTQCISYRALQKALDVASVRQLEDVLIEAVYSNVIKGKLDNCKKQVEVVACIGRDISSKNVGRLVQMFSDWCFGCERVCYAIELQINRIKNNREQHI